MINIGLLWYDPARGIPLVDRVDAAAERYVQKYGVAPNVCLVPETEESVLDRITVRGDRRMRSGHLLVGFDPEDAEATRWRPIEYSSVHDVVLLGPDGEEVRAYRPRLDSRERAEAKKLKSVTSKSRSRGQASVPAKLAVPVVEPMARPLPPRPTAESEGIVLPPKTVESAKVTPNKTAKATRSSRIAVDRMSVALSTKKQPAAKPIPPEVEILLPAAKLPPVKAGEKRSTNKAAAKPVKESKKAVEQTQLAFALDVEPAPAAKGKKAITPGKSSPAASTATMKKTATTKKSSPKKAVLAKSATKSAAVAKKTSPAKPKSQKTAVRAASKPAAPSKVKQTKAVYLPEAPALKRPAGQRRPKSAPASAAPGTGFVGTVATGKSKVRTSGAVRQS